MPKVTWLVRPEPVRPRPESLLKAHAARSGDSAFKFPELAFPSPLPSTPSPAPSHRMCPWSLLPVEAAGLSSHRPVAFPVAMAAALRGLGCLPGPPRCSAPPVWGPVSDGWPSSLLMGGLLQLWPFDPCPMTFPSAPTQASPSTLATHWDVFPRCGSFSLSLPATVPALTHPDVFPGLPLSSQALLLPTASLTVETHLLPPPRTSPGCPVGDGHVCQGEKPTDPPRSGSSVCECHPEASGLWGRSLVRANENQPTNASIGGAAISCFSLPLFLSLPQINQ